MSFSGVFGGKITSLFQPFSLNWAELNWAELFSAHSFATYFLLSVTVDMTQKKSVSQSVALETVLCSNVDSDCLCLRALITPFIIIFWIFFVLLSCWDSTNWAGKDCRLLQTTESSRSQFERGQEERSLTNLKGWLAMQKCEMVGKRGEKCVKMSSVNYLL